MKKPIILLAIGNILLLSIIIFLNYKANSQNPTIVYIDKVRVFEGFNMTKEMKTVGESAFQKRKASIEALYASLTTITDTKQKDEILRQIGLQKEELEAFSNSFATHESHKIWTRINNYSEAFSKDNHYKMLITTEGKKEILYGDPSLDVTDKLLQYINNKFEGND